MFLSVPSGSESRTYHQKLVRKVKRRIRWFKFRREVGFLRLVGLSQTIRFVAGRLRGENAIELTVPGAKAPLICRTYGADRWALWHVFGRQHFEMPEHYSPELIVDGGANVGYASVYFANRYPDARIIAVEPNTDNCALFSKNCAAYSNVELVQGALWSSNTDLIIENPAARSHAFRVVEVPSPTNRSFKGFSVADILARSGKQYIDLLKLDIEGSEEQVFSSNYKDWIGCVKRVMVETHGTRSRRVVSTTAKNHGFSVSRIGEYTVLEKRIESTAEEERRLRNSMEHLHGPKEIAYEEDELVVVCIVRDGLHHVEPFVDHYFSLGAKHIVFLDNNSTDGTVEALKKYDSVTVLRTELPYKAPGISVGNGWTREVIFKKYLISRFGGKNRWCLCADVDELFDYPYSDVMGLNSLLRYLNSKSYTAAAAQMLDMFSEKPLSGQKATLDEPLKTSHRFYDISNMKRRSLKSLSKHRDNVLDSDELESFSGGIRESIFGHKPFLTKYPLVFNDGKVQPMNGGSHWVGNASVADFTGVLLHYKLLNEHFRVQVDQAVREEHRLQNSAVYKVYKKTLDREPMLRVKLDTAKELKSVNDLIENQLLIISEDYVSWVNAEEEKIVSQAESLKPDEAYLNVRKQDRLETLRTQREERRLRDRRRLIELESRQREWNRLESKQRRLSKKNRALKLQLRAIHSSRSWRLINKLNWLVGKSSRAKP